MPDATTTLPITLQPTHHLTVQKFLRFTFQVALGTSILTASSWISIPTVPVPVTMQTCAVIVIGALFGARMGVLTVLAWLVEAAIGLPVLAHGAAGPAVFVGPTAGYLFSFLIVAALTGWLSDRELDRGALRSFCSMLAANAINLILGVAWLATLVGWHRAWIAGFLPFWIGGILKALLATIIIVAFRRSSRRPRAKTSSPAR